MITRRGLLGGMLGSLVVAFLPEPQTLAVKAWRWTELPGTGIEIHATAAVRVTYTADGTVTAPLSLAPPTAGSDRGTQTVAPGPGYGIALRRIS